jgi:hypothetical protein
MFLAHQPTRLQFNALFELLFLQARLVRVLWLLR